MYFRLKKNWFQYIAYHIWNINARFPFLHTQKSAMYEPPLKCQRISCTYIRLYHLSNPDHYFSDWHIQIFSSNQTGISTQYKLYLTNNIFWIKSKNNSSKFFKIFAYFRCSVCIVPQDECVIFLVCVYMLHYRCVFYVLRQWVEFLRNKIGSVRFIPDGSVFSLFRDQQAKSI